MGDTERVSIEQHRPGRPAPVRRVVRPVDQALLPRLREVLGTGEQERVLVGDALHVHPRARRADPVLGRVEHGPARRRIRLRRHHGGHPRDGAGVLPGYSGLMFLVIAVMAVVSLAIVLPTYAVMWRRLQDANFHGAFTLLSLVGLGIVPLVMCALPSSPEGVRFDPAYAGHAAPYGFDQPYSSPAYDQPVRYGPAASSPAYGQPAYGQQYGQQHGRAVAALQPGLPAGRDVVDPADVRRPVLRRNALRPAARRRATGRAAAVAAAAPTRTGRALSCARRDTAPSAGRATSGAPSPSRRRAM